MRYSILGQISLLENWDTLKKREEKIKSRMGNSIRNADKNPTKTGPNDKERKDAGTCRDKDHTQKKKKEKTIQKKNNNTTLGNQPGIPSERTTFTRMNDQRFDHIDSKGHKQRNRLK